MRVRTAVGASAGEVRLKLNPRHHADHRVASGNGPEPDGETVAVPLVTIDEYLEERDCTTPVCFIKIDVQGYEPAVCYGAERTLARNPGCSIALEYAPEAMKELGFRAGELMEWLAARGYAARGISKNGELTEGIPAHLGKRGYADLLFTRPGTGLRPGGD